MPPDGLLCAFGGMAICLPIVACVLLKWPGVFLLGMDFALLRDLCVFQPSAFSDLALLVMV